MQQLMCQQLMGGFCCSEVAVRPPERQRSTGGHVWANAAYSHRHDCLNGCRGVKVVQQGVGHNTQ